MKKEHLSSEENFYKEKELAENPDMSRILEKQRILLGRMRPLEYNDFILGVRESLGEKGLSEAEIQDCAAWHILISSGVDWKTKERIDFEGDLSIEGFIDKKLEELEEGK